MMAAYGAYEEAMRAHLILDQFLSANLIGGLVCS
jgi:hypothetical protein